MKFFKHYLLILLLAKSGFSTSALYTLLAGMGIFLPVQNVIFASSFILLTSILPIYGIGGFGTIEAIWTLVYVPLGMTLNDAIISGFSYHLIILLYTLFLGLTGILCLRWR